MPKGTYNARIVTTEVFTRMATMRMRHATLDVATPAHILSGAIRRR